MKASPESGRVSLHQHVSVGVFIKTLQSIFNTFRRVTVSSWRNMVCERSVDLVKPFRDGLIVKLIVSVVFISINSPVSGCEGIPSERCLIWGPGLNADTVLPVRYFFIQAVGSNGENLTLSPGKPTTNTACAQRAPGSNTGSLKCWSGCSQKAKLAYFLRILFFTTKVLNIVLCPPSTDVTETTFNDGLIELASERRGARTHHAVIILTISP